jgi:hypothetical protein
LVAVRAFGALAPLAVILAASPRPAYADNCLMVLQGGAYKVAVESTAEPLLNAALIEKALIELRSSLPERLWPKMALCQSMPAGIYPRLVSVLSGGGSRITCNMFLSADGKKTKKLVSDDSVCMKKVLDPYLDRVRTYFAAVLALNFMQEIAKKTRRDLGQPGAREQLREERAAADRLYAFACKTLGPVKDPEESNFWTEVEAAYSALVTQVNHDPLKQPVATAFLNARSAETGNGHLICGTRTQ